MRDITKAIISLRPNAKWSLEGNEYEGLVWLADEETKPTEEEVNVELARLEEEYKLIEYKQKRATEYPPIGDQLDALWKGGDAAAEMLAKVQAVKNKYPKGAA
jgi:hypothetical protein